MTGTSTTSDPLVDRRHAGQRVAPLDGVRGVAILAVMAFHSGIPGLAVGGFFGVDAFFVLSGLVITTILLQEWHRTQAIGLGRFYAGRIRRLIPALLVMLIAVALFVGFVAPAGEYPGFQGDALSVVGYFSNWHFISTGTNYFALSAAPSLLTHTWTLAIEEQFYVVWPLLVIGALWLTRHHRSWGLPALLALAVGGAAASGGWMAHLYDEGVSQTRLYYGTDTHVQSIMVGCALAVVLAMINQRRGDTTFVPLAHSRRARVLVSGAGIGAAVGLAWQWTHVGNADPVTYRGGFLLGATLTAVVLASVSCAPAGPLAVLLSMRWLRALGTISYGMYLWYFPIFQFVDGSRTGLTGYVLFALRVAIDVAIATCSFVLIERPVRRGALFRHAKDRGTVPWPSLSLLASALGITIAVLVLTTSGSSVSIGDPVAAVANRTTGSLPPPPMGVTRVLLVGDSTALTLGFAIPPQGPTWDISLDDTGSQACGVAIGPLVKEDGVVGLPGAACNPATPLAQQWPAELRSAVGSDHPNVVALLAGRWEMVDRLYHGQWTNITHPAFRAYVERQLNLAVHIGTASGAHMVLLTAPCFASGEQPDGSPWPEDTAARLAIYNSLVREVAAGHPATTSVVNLYAMVCPGGTFHSVLDGVTVRAPDGIHFPYYHFGQAGAAAPDTRAQSDAFGRWMAPRLIPQLVAHASPPSPSGRNPRRSST